MVLLTSGLKLAFEGSIDAFWYVSALQGTTTLILVDNFAAVSAFFIFAAAGTTKGWKCCP